MENENKLNANRQINYVNNYKLNGKLDSKNKMTQLRLHISIFNFFEFFSYF